MPDEKINFGIFLDSSPDRWGRVLMRRREALIARMENRPQKTLMPSDYLLDVYDEHRMGRFVLKNFHSEISYLDIIGFIQQHGDKNCINADLEELWRRIVFGISIKNTDDHLRNHGFILGTHGWRLSPAYDINPVPTGTGLTLNISDEDNSLDIQLALNVADFFRVEKRKAKEITENIKGIVSSWQSIASKHALSRREQELMSAAFE